MPVAVAMAEESALPPLPANHGFAEGDRVVIPVYGLGRITGTVKHIDTRIGKKLYRGFVVVADRDNRFYTLDPQLAQKLPPTLDSLHLSTTPAKAPAT